MKEAFSELKVTEMDLSSRHSLRGGGDLRKLLKPIDPEKLLIGARAHLAPESEVKVQEVPARNSRP